MDRGAQLAEETVLRLQRFFQKKSTEISPFRYEALNDFLSGVESDLLNEKILDKIPENNYNALWDTIEEIRNKCGSFDKENMCIGFMGSVKKIYEVHLRQRAEYKLQIS